MWLRLTVVLLTGPPIKIRTEELAKKKLTVFWDLMGCAPSTGTYGWFKALPSMEVEVGSINVATTDQIPRCWLAQAEKR